MEQSRRALPKVPPYVITSSQEVREIVDVLTRARDHLSNCRLAMCAALIQQAENKLVALGKEEDDAKTK